MEIKLEYNKLIKIMQSFYQVTNIRIIIFNKDGKEILSYPEKGNNFCLEMQKNCLFAQNCEISNHQYFNIAKNTEYDEIQLYHCHSGLVEATMPLISNNELIGYAMFGQITDIENRDLLRKTILQKVEKYKIDELPSLDTIYYFTKEKIMACKDILNACISFILSHQYISYKRDDLLAKIDVFIKNNIGNDLNAYDICHEFGISRTSLYNLFNEAYEIGVSEYIMNMRISTAKKMLLDLNHKVNEIATLVGFDDYNYFSKVFKSKTGMSPTLYRKVKSK